jgi:hypothetical protein
MPSPAVKHVGNWREPTDARMRVQPVELLAMRLFTPLEILSVPADGEDLESVFVAEATMLHR